jgi:hypothetical protein
VAASELRDRLMHEDGTGLAADVIEDAIADYPGNYPANDDETRLGVAS